MIAARQAQASLQRAGALLGAFAGELDHLAELPASQVSALLCQVAAVQTALAARLVRALEIGDPAGAGDRDRLLTVAEAAERLACSKDWLYRHRLPFAVRNGRQLRFSADGLDRYIRTRAGRVSPSLPAGAER
jgi:excisionase family DNA binding protein